MHTLLWLLVTGAVYSLLMFLGWLVAAARVRPAVEAVELFSGPPLWAGRVAGVPVTVGSIPWGAALRLPDLEDPSALEEGTTEYEHLPAGAQALLEFLPVLCVTALAALILREPTLGLVLSGLREIVAGGLSPRGEGVRLVTAWIGLLGSPTVAVAVLLTKLAALNLLPLPSSALGRFLLARLGRRGAGWITLVGAFAGLGLSVSWLFAILLALF